MPDGTPSHHLQTADPAPRSKYRGAHRKAERPWLSIVGTTTGARDAHRGAGTRSRHRAPGQIRTADTRFRSPTPRPIVSRFHCQTTGFKPSCIGWLLVVSRLRVPLRYLAPHASAPAQSKPLARAVAPRDDMPTAREVPVIALRQPGPSFERSQAANISCSRWRSPKENENDRGDARGT